MLELAVDVQAQSLGDSNGCRLDGSLKVDKVSAGVAACVCIEGLSEEVEGLHRPPSRVSDVDPKDKIPDWLLEKVN
jgi:hypothetical protein